MDYTQVTPEQRAEMLATIGADGVEDLFGAIPSGVRFRGELDIPPGASELELQRELLELASRTAGAHNRVCFKGGGAYDHFIPALIDQLISRGEFLTAYTPYQAEASQGSLQAFFEFQTQIARLTGLEIANSSLYEGATAVAEGVLLSLNATGKRRVLVAGSLHPEYRAVLRTYTEDLACEMVELPVDADGRLAVETVREHGGDDTACLVVASPNVYGLIEDWDGLFAAVKASSTVGKEPMAIAVFNPISLGLLRHPGECGADVAAGEGQPLGNPLSFGGPYLGLFAAKKQFLRKMPGRLVGRAKDADDRSSYCLTLQTREQHIKGAKATSNICTNQGLYALRATMYMTTLGPEGLREVARQCYDKAHYLAERIDEIEGYELAYRGAFFHEFVVRCPIDAHEVLDRCRARGFLAGVPLGSERMGGIGASNELLVAVTEKRTREELDGLVSALVEAASASGVGGAS